MGPEMHHWLLKPNSKTGADFARLRRTAAARFLQMQTGGLVRQGFGADGEMEAGTAPGKNPARSSATEIL